MDLHLIIYRHTQKEKGKRKEIQKTEDFMDWGRLATYGSSVTSGSAGREPNK